MKLVICMLLGFVVAGYAAPPQEIPILKYENEGVNPDGSYRWSYETGNGITAEEEARPSGPEILRVQGSYQFNSLEGVPVSISYVADENGFQPQGDVIPKSIQKALAWIVSHPGQEDVTQRRTTTQRPTTPYPQRPQPLPTKPPTTTPVPISQNAAITILKGG